MTCRLIAAARPIASSSRPSGERASSRVSLGASLSTGWSTRQRPVEGIRSSCAAVIRSGFVALFARLEELDGLRRHDRRDRVLVDKLRMRIAPEQYAEIVEPGNDALELYAIDEEHGDRSLVLADVIEEDILNVLRLFRRHGDSPSSVLAA